MPIGEVLVIVMFVATFACLLAGFPVAFTLSGVAALFGLFSYAFGIFDISFMRAMPQRIFGNGHDQRGSPRRAPVCVHGRDVGAIESRRGAAWRPWGASLRTPARRPGDFGVRGWRAFWRHRPGSSVRHRGDDGPAGAADDATGEGYDPAKLATGTICRRGDARARSSRPRSSSSSWASKSPTPMSTPSASHR